MGRYERLGDQSRDARNAVKMLPKSMQRGLGQSPEDIAGKVALVANAVAAGAAKLENPTPPAPPPPVAVDIPYIPIGVTVVALVALYFFFLRKK